MPDIEEPPFTSKNFNAFEKGSKKVCNFTVSFRGDPSSWFVELDSKIEKKSNAEIKEGDIVLCNNKNLNSYYGRTGEVIQVNKHFGDLEFDINFGNHICRMTKENIDVVFD